MSGEIDESSVNQMSAEDERDLLARQRDAVLEYCQRVDRNGGGGYVRTDVIYQLVITDPEDDERPWFADVDVAVVEGVVQLLGDGGKLIANLPGDRPGILRDMLVDGIRERDRQGSEMAGRMPVSTLPDLVERLRQARHERGLTQRDVAEALRVDHSSVSHWEIGLARPTAGGLIAWARLVGMPLWAIPDREELTDA